ncbi:calcium and integrin-binding protein 1-like isoform X2 [Scyliorhinus canicula]|uniref:calcium and integrin-binding protein 1-like isoform X2 n=1 Tax=Scyliorhinus canicula TaxID=7830 RepID=UPI0018F4CB60|nr:calcium and integrin-binding protein 1-like isoform X2 [Scyliorhinus canicula]
MADGFKSRLFDILKPSSWNFQNLTFPWRFSNDRLSQVQLKEYQELTFLTKHEIIRASERFKELVPEHIKDFTRRTVRSPMQQMVQINELKANPFKRRICKIFSTSKLNNGSISFEDFLDMFSAFSEAAPASVKAEYAFRIMDFNDSGAIERTDLSQFLTLITGNESHKILNDMEMRIIIDMIMEDIDMDGDERINLSEFHHIASKMPDFASYFTMTVY